MVNFVKKFFINTYGCQMNVHESEKIAGILSSLGYESANTVEESDIVVFNTCCIRENAEQKAEGNIGALKKLKREKKDLIIAVGGCMTQQKGRAERLRKKFPFIDIIFGTHNLEQFEVLLRNRLETNKKVIEVLSQEGEVVEGTNKLRTSYPNAWVNITYGCNNFCTYCIVPYVRGRERSRKLSDIVAECKAVIDNGYKEITLLGQNVNSYGKDLQGVNFATLIEEISKIEGDFRLSYMTNHPKDFNEELIKAIAKSNKTSKYVHLPIQSGSTRILKLMNRKYTREEYIEKVKLLRKYIPDVCISTDIMVGFPTETEQDFLDTLSLVEEVKFSSAFTFVYSKREGTPAAKMDGQIDEETGKDRIMRLIEAQNRISTLDSERFISKTVRVLCEDYDSKKNKYLGRNEYGKMVYFTGSEEHLGNFVNVKITSHNGISLYGEIVV